MRDEREGEKGCGIPLIALARQLRIGAELAKSAQSAGLLRRPRCEMARKGAIIAETPYPAVSERARVGIPETC